jgi:hypothetical protein
MNSIGSGCDRNVNTIVHDQQHAKPPGRLHRLERRLEELARRGVLFTQLNHRRAAPSQSFNLLGVSEPAKSYVCDWI